MLQKRKGASPSLVLRSGVMSQSESSDGYYMVDDNDDESEGSDVLSLISYVINLFTSRCLSVTLRNEWNVYARVKQMGGY